MGFEDDYNPSGTITKVTRNVLGPRGIDRISITENSATTHGYPMYDGHGNCRGVLTKNGTSYGTGNWRTYDVWGSVRSGSATGDPKSRYVASIGHVADDESSLIYMRARYYEPATGRFLSQDRAMQGCNWFVYAGSNPTNFRDPSGKSFEPILKMLTVQLGLLGAMTCFAGLSMAMWAVTPADIVLSPDIVMIGLEMSSTAVGLLGGFGVDAAVTATQLCRWAGLCQVAAPVVTSDDRRTFNSW
jgi:RHS repeat-associated protein